MPAIHRSIYAREALSNYLSGEWNVDQLENWAVEFWDIPERREDAWSSAVAGEVLERLRELGDGVRSAEEFDAALTAILAPDSAERQSA